MKKQLLKKQFAFIIIAMVFSALPQFINAQPRPCPKGTKQVCILKVCHCVPKGNGHGIGYNATSQQSVDFELDYPSAVSIKIYDVTGKLIKTLANSRMQQGYHQIEWDKKDEDRNVVNAGIYFLQVNTGSKSETRKLSVGN